LKHSVTRWLAAWSRPASRWFFGLLVLLLGLWLAPAETSGEGAGMVVDICPAAALQTRPSIFQTGGIILTTFDRDSLWVYDIDRKRRYPLPETAPCGQNCHLSPDFRWITYFNNATNTYNKMRLDGTERSMLVEYAGDVEWWSPDTLLIWTPGHSAYLREENGTQRDYLPVNGVISVQPGGFWGLAVEPIDNGFKRALINLRQRGLPDTPEQRIELGPEIPYFSASSWSPDGRWFAYVAPGAFDDTVLMHGSEIYGVRPGETAPMQWTRLTERYGATRINGRSVGSLSWSPDGTRIAFWVTELTGRNPATDTGDAVIHIYDLNQQEVRRYCGYSTIEHTPEPPRLVWSPDGTHLAFGGNIPDDDLGYLLLALNVETGVFTILSDGIYPALGTADVIAWGLPPR